MKLTIVNIGESRVVFKDPQGYTYLAGEVDGGDTETFEVSADLVYRIGPQLQDLVANPILKPDGITIQAGITWSAVPSSGDGTVLSYTDITRPAANTVPTGTMIYNTSDNAPNWADAVANVWRDATGTIT